MQLIDTLRQAVADAAARKLGLSAKQNYQNVQQGRGRGQASDILGLPVDTRGYSRLQDPLTGEIAFVMDATPLDSAPIG